MCTDHFTPESWTTPFPSHRRRPPALSRVRPKSAMVGDYNRRDQKDLVVNDWPSFGSQRFKPEQDVKPHALDNPFDCSKPLPIPPDPEPKHRPTTSFSSALLPGFRGIARRMSNSLRLGGSRHGTYAEVRFDKQLASAETFEIPNHDKQDSGIKPKGAGWFRSPLSLRQRYARPSLDNISFPTPLPPKHTNAFPIPGHGSEPPILPDHTSGSAARASAAAQNEMLGVTQVLVTKADAQPMDNQFPRDSESGIGIDLRDRVDNGSDSEIAIVRRDPTQYLPPELSTHILSYLDSQSVLNASEVSHSWNEAASSRHVWKDVFVREYAKKVPQTPGHSLIPRGAGLGRVRPEQDWKKMFLVRKALDNRWKQGKAAAIYLEGHKDSVYCVQFDETKIVTGSRDQTIRIWDPHTYECVKVIGAPPLHSATVTSPGPFANPANHYTVQSAGQLPFTSISPPATLHGSSDIASRRVSSSDYHQASILCLQFDEEIMVTGSSDHTCIVWDVKNDYTPIRRLRGHRAGVLDVCFDHRYIVSCSKDTYLCVWDRNTGELLKRLTGHRGPVNAVELRGDLVVSASGDGIAKLWNLTSGLCVKEFPSKDRGLACVEFSEDGRTILAGGNDQVIYQFDANTGELVNELRGHRNLVRSLHLDSSNGRVVSGSYDMSVKVFDFETGNLIIDFPGWTTSWMLSAKSDYRRIVATSQDSRAVIMDFGYGLDGVHLLES